MVTNRKKVVSFSALAVISALSLSLSSETTQAFSTAPQSVSGKQKVTWGVGGDCADLYDDNQTSYLIYEGEDCYFTVKVVPSKPQRTVALQYQEGARWITESEVKTGKNGVAILRPKTTDSYGDFLCSYWDYRLGVARLGSAKPLLSSTFNVEFIADDGFCS